MSVFATQPWFYWLLLALFALAVVAAFWFFRWHVATEATRLTRRIDVLNGDGVEDRIARLYWTHMRDVECALAKLLTVERAVREHPERIAALLSENVPLTDAIEAVV